MRKEVFGDDFDPRGGILGESLHRWMVSQQAKTNCDFAPFPASTHHPQPICQQRQSP
jgi:hypothetical protein